MMNFPRNQKEEGNSLYNAMTKRRRASRSAALILVCFGLTNPLAPPADAAAPEGSLPAPTRAFTPKTAIAFYADVQGASKSAIWNAITNKAAPLLEQLKALQRAQMSSLPKTETLPGLERTDIAEMAIVIEGEKVLSELQAERFDPSS